MNHNIGRQTENRIVSLQALRAIAFLGVFFTHANFIIQWSRLGVSIFFVMSGFLMTYRYQNSELDIGLKSRFVFSIKRIKKLYPLHLITMCFAIVLNIEMIVHNGAFFRDFLDLIGRTILNITLMQTWIPDRSINTSLNGVAWYLSVTMFLYFMFPCIRRVVENKSRLFLCLICVFFLFFEIVVCMPFIILFGNDSPVYFWFMYCFPVFRLGDFFIGCALNRIILLENVRKVNGIYGTFCEVIAVALTIGVILFLKELPKNVFFLSLNNWTTVYIPLASIWTVLFIANRGIITRILTNPILILIGNISAPAFLIHYVLILWTNRLLLSRRIEVEGWDRNWLIFIELSITLFLSALYQRYHARIKG